jgi:phenylacetate-CoA ligase
MIRLLSNDLTRWTNDPCPCGRTYPRLPLGIYGRVDDVVIVRGAKIYPMAIEDTLRAIDGCGAEFRVIVSRTNALDELLIQVEVEGGLTGSAAQPQLQTMIRERLRARIGVYADIELLAPGVLPRTEFKARRVVDRRARANNVEIGR